jgi:hypothetical protein
MANTGPFPIVPEECTLAFAGLFGVKFLSVSINEP